LVFSKMQSFSSKTGKTLIITSIPEVYFKNQSRKPFSPINLRHNFFFSISPIFVLLFQVIILILCKHMTGATFWWF
jgi:hypothetical protein